MAKYIGVVLTIDGFFCAAPAWKVEEGDLIALPNALTGESGLHEVISVVTDSVDGEFLGMIEKYVGSPLPKITAKFSKKDLEWGGADGVE